ncbi:sensor histidine kinase [Kordia sp. YSTF-M3]|uniref:histidine kinase n=1 Tax=Kordia aestuariivivens TaxID=2759037 RepID=A0ABR7Q946_9FLAO|nr:sensor histidine kinase [Kordia aestuariivivens]MBC8755101.1 sensor histidine kinase [Kordia aestuariivivens]
MIFKTKEKYCLLFILFLCNVLISQTSKRILDLSNIFKDRSLSFEVKKDSLDKAYRIAQRESNDSLKNVYYSKLSYAYYRINDEFMFKKVNKEGVLLSTKLKDSITLGDHYWDMGAFYKKNKKLDSAYYFYNNTKKIFSSIGELKKVASIWFNIGQIQKDVRDYTGSEIAIINAIEIFQDQKDYNSLYNCYNLLGIIYNNLEEYEKAIKCYKDSLEYLRKSSKDDIREATILNNIGIVYRNLGNHALAIKKYKEGLNYDSIYYKNTRLYATLTDNLAYSKFILNDHDDLPDLFYKALHIRDSLNISVGLLINKIHLSEYYLRQKDTIQSLKFSTEAMVLGKKIKSYDHLLDNYKLLAKIEPNNSNKYLNEYIKLNDSLVIYERGIRNKFARIKFETDVVITENKKLSIQNTWIVATSTALIFFGFLIYVITQQRTRNKELEMEQQQQRANEEIYNLMIDQQDKIEEGRKREKERISLELHDGILGRLFGTRLSLGSLNSKDDLSSKKMREQYIYELQSIEEEVRNISHELGIDNFNSTTSYSTMIANLLEEQSKITNFKYIIEDDDRIVWTDIPGHIKINIYRIVQESIQNINKYAQAENVILDFKKNDDHIILTIKDDGVGFDQEKRSSGIGLKNMKSRVALLHGQFTINSIPGKGTSISVDVPMT